VTTHQNTATAAAAAGAHQIVNALLPLATPAPIPAALTPADNKIRSQAKGSSTSKNRKSIKKTAAEMAPAQIVHGGEARVPPNCMKVQNRKHATVVKMLRAVIPVLLARWLSVQHRDDDEGGQDPQVLYPSRSKRDRAKKCFGSPELYGCHNAGTFHTAAAKPHAS